MDERKASPSALRVDGIYKNYGSVAVLTGVDLTVEPGSVTAVLGPSGCGKTTLLRMIAGFDAPDAGTVAIDGEIVASSTKFVPPERRRVGVVPQEGALFPHLSVAGNVGFGLPRGAESRKRIEEVLDLVGLPGIERRRPNELSGGQQQRVALARALAPRPSIVVLDEPFSSLDTGLRDQVRADVLAALRASGATAILVTHDQLEALSVADQVAVLLGGRVAQAGAPTTLYDDPASLAVATFVGDAVVLDGSLHGDTVECALGRLPLRSARTGTSTGPVSVLLRPEQLAIAPSGAGDPAVGTVVSCSYFGHDAMVVVRIVDGTEVRVRLHATELPPVGSVVAVSVRCPVPVFARTASASL